jgi:putative transposase
VLDADMHLCCQDATQKVCGDFGAELRDFKGEDDQVHLLAGYPPKLSVAGLADSLNGVSARQMRSQFTAT